MPKPPVVMLAAVMLWGTSARAAEPVGAARHYLFPTPGDVTLTTAIGVPYLAVAEMSVGITRSFSMGVLFAVLKESACLSGSAAARWWFAHCRLKNS